MTEPRHWANADIAGLDNIVELGLRLHAGDTIDYVDDGTGSGGYMEGCGGDRDWDCIKTCLSSQHLMLADHGGGYTVELIGGE